MVKGLNFCLIGKMIHPNLAIEIDLKTVGIFVLFI